MSSNLTASAKYSMSDTDQYYELSLRLLGNEIFAIKFSSNSASNKWLAIAIIAGAAALGFLAFFGQDLLSLVK